MSSIDSVLFTMFCDDKPKQIFDPFVEISGLSEEPDWFEPFPDPFQELHLPQPSIFNSEANRPSFIPLGPCSITVSDFTMSSAKPVPEATHAHDMAAVTMGSDAPVIDGWRIGTALKESRWLTSSAKPVPEATHAHDMAAVTMGSDAPVIDDRHSPSTTSSSPEPEAQARQRPKGRIPRRQEKPSYWSKEEHGLFLEGLKMFSSRPDDDTERPMVGLGAGVAELLATFIGTRSVSQVRSHAQKHFIREWRTSK
mmetsp:Transcript_71138/g.148364  ORF Transcript_71138/g.148364 Transcript_71138/m.148364 type:complete len:253 (+) Transcript_71138:58-816(+)